MNDYLKEWKSKNPDYSKEYYIKNKEKLNKYHEEWIKNNNEANRKYQKEYHKKYYKEKKLKDMNKKVEAFKATLLMSNLGRGDINPLNKN
jgi:hypothetical protein